MSTLHSLWLQAAAWLHVQSALGVSRLTVALTIVLMVVDWRLGRSADPRLRSIAASLAAFLKAFGQRLNLDRLPIIGQVFGQLMDFISVPPAPAAGPAGPLPVSPIGPDDKTPKPPAV